MAGVNIRVGGPADAFALSALRRAWTAERSEEVPDDDFEAHFLEWYERESSRRVTWLAEVGGSQPARFHPLNLEYSPGASFGV